MQILQQKYCNQHVQKCKTDSKIVTNAYRSYNGLSANYTHVSIKHTDGNYITIGEDHTNTIEGFWSLLKRGIGIHHNVGPKHLQAYCNEFEYRNSRKITDVSRLEDAFKKVDNKRLTYAPSEAFLFKSLRLDRYR